MIRIRRSCFVALTSIAFTCFACSLGMAQARFRRIQTIAGNGAETPVLEKGRAQDTALTNPFGVQPEADGSLIIASYDQHAVYRLEPTYSRFEKIAGTGSKGYSEGAGQFPTLVEMNQPHEVQVGPEGDIYIADTMNHRIGVIDGRSGRWRNIAGNGVAGFSGDGDAAVDAVFNQAYSIALDGSELFVADLKNNRIRLIDLKKKSIRTICGTGQRALPEDGGLAIEQPLAGPRSLAVDAENLWIVLREGNSVWRYERQSARIFHVAGTGKKGATGDGGDAKLATFAGPKGIAVEPDVALFVADTENHTIREINLRTGKIGTLVGVPGESGFNGDGDELASRTLNRPHGVCLLPDGSLLVGDSENHRLRIVTK